MMHPNLLARHRPDYRRVQFVSQSWVLWRFWPTDCRCPYVEQIKMTMPPR